MKMYFLLYGGVSRQSEHTEDGLLEHWNDIRCEGYDVKNGYIVICFIFYTK